MARVLVRTRVGGGTDWTDESREMSRIPCVGEFVTLGGGGPWYKVEAVVHTADGGAYDGEIYARAEEEHADGITRNIAAAPPR